ncbi:MAG: hypothetical protein GEU73_04915 [Chloroflexi bacterium]|nr:hypothetical protein [Chloroflexota bacterium]
MAATGGWTGVGARSILDTILGGGILYVGLATVQVTATDTLATITEVTTAGYARQAVTWGAGAGDAPAVIANSGLLTFDFDPAADPPSTQYAFLTDAASGTVGDIVYRWSANAAVDGGADEDYQIAIGALQVSVETTEVVV